MPISNKYYKKKTRRNAKAITFPRRSGFRPNPYRQVSAYVGVKGTELKYNPFGGVVTANLLNRYSCRGTASYDPAAAIDAHYNLMCATNIQQGTSAITRIGNVIYAQYMEIRGEIQNIDATNCPHIARLIVFVEPNSIGDTPAENDILDNVNTGDNSYVFASRRINTYDRFRVLRDKLINLPPANLNGAHVPFHMVIPLHFKIQYNGTANPPTPGQVDHNSIWVMCLATTGASGNVVWRLAGRLRYTDS